MGLDREVEEKIDQLQEDSDEVIRVGTDMFSEVKTRMEGGSYIWVLQGEYKKKQIETIKKYEAWYNSARPLISEYLTDRLDDFEEEYQSAKRWLRFEEDAPNSASIGMNRFGDCIWFQKSLLASIPDRVDSERLRAREQVSTDIATEELQRARTLLEEGHIRASGVLAGIALERHLQTMCETADNGIQVEKMAGISSLAQDLYEAKQIDQNALSLLKHLGSIRNDCSHANEEEPTKGEVERLISEANNFIYS